MDVSRRDFFKSIIPKAEQKNSVEAEQSIFILGHLNAFPVHSATKVNLMEKELLMESLPEGLRLKDPQTNNNLKLSLSTSGLIQAHTNEFWPPAAVLSILTGEIYII